MSEQNTQEPTMEEILASIRRIISEDDAPAAAPVALEESATPPHGDVHEDILELTERVQEDADAGEDAESMFEAAPEPAQVESSGDLDIYSRPAEAASAADLDPEADDDYAPDEPLVSAPIAATASSSFVQLARTVEMGAGHTLEDIVREMLRPMLKQWLDSNLPGIVETAVQAEVERIARRRFS
jgi:hypothetical protein